MNINFFATRSSQVFAALLLAALSGCGNSGSSGSDIGHDQAMTEDSVIPVFYPDDICMAAVGFHFMVDDLNKMTAEIVADGQVRVKSFAQYNGGAHDTLCNLHDDGRIDFSFSGVGPAISGTTYDYKIVGGKLRIRELQWGNVQKQNIFRKHKGLGLTLEQ